MTPQAPRVGVVVFVRRGNELLFGQRLGKHGVGTWSIPGGAVEPGETPQEAAERELREETGIAWHVVPVQAWTFTTFPDGQAWVTLYYCAYVPADSKAHVMEPDKCKEWRWIREGDELPYPLFAPLSNFVDQIGYKGLWRT